MPMTPLVFAENIRRERPPSPAADISPETPQIPPVAAPPLASALRPVASPIRVSVTATSVKTDLFAPGGPLGDRYPLSKRAMTNLPMPAAVATMLDGHARSDDRERMSSLVAPQASRWSGDAWVFLRESGAQSASGSPLPPSYGASQLGAVLRFRLAQNNALHPAAYVRVSHALVKRGESEAAAGLSLRPIAGLPVTAHAEMRLTERPDENEIRPAAFLVAGGEGAGLPLGLTARAYVQTGYVGGRHATAFADGQLVADRKVARSDLVELRAGAGAWGGAQRGAARFDLGPSASLVAKVGETPVRLSADYRLRVAGDAEPGASAALTLSTGF